MRECTPVRVQGGRCMIGALAVRSAWVVPCMVRSCQSGQVRPAAMEAGNRLVDSLDVSKAAIQCRIVFAGEESNTNLIEGI